MSIALVLGSGGHTTELLNIISHLPDSSITSPSNHFVIYSSGDFLSLAKYSNLMEAAPEVVREIPRARRVGQSYFTSIFTTIYSLLMTCFIFLRKYPKLIICNGPAVSVTITIAAYLIHIISLGFIKRSKIIYIESVARSKSLSLSGKIMIHFADDFLIQWPELAQKYQSYKNVKYTGLLV